MKQVQAVIQPFKANEVIDALQQLSRIRGITALEVRGYGVKHGKDGIDHAAWGSLNHADKVMLIVTVRDALVKTVVDMIEQHAHTGNDGDGVVFVLPVEEAIRVRDGVRGEEAL